jgi:uroporphyrinogen III methyltransferase / synthase
MPERWKSSKRWDASVPDPAISLSPSPLAGKHVVITRPIAQSAALCEALRANGAEPLQFPLIRIVPADDLSKLDEGLVQLRPGDWIVFTSQNAVPPVAERLQSLRGKNPAVAQGIQIAAIGGATERVAKEAGFTVQRVAKGDGGVSLAKALHEWAANRRILIPRSDLADDAMPAILREFGGEVIEVVVYRTEPTREFAEDLNANLDSNSVDAIVCFSPSAVHSLFENIGAERLRRVQQKIVFAAIGATTASAFAEIGISKPLVAANTTLEGIVDTLSAHFAGTANFQSYVEPAPAGAKRV